MSAAGCQRWRERRESYRPQGEIINPAAFGVELLREREARPFVERHHYSSTYPAARRAFGLMRARKWFAPELCGVAVFSVPAQGQAISKWLDARGRTVSERALSKIRCQERGWEGAMRALLVAGAPARRFGEEPDAWLARALSSGAFRRTQHPGNHAYALRGLTSSPVHPARAALLSALASSQEVFPSYPKMREEVQP